MVNGRSRFDVALEALAHVRRRTLLVDLLSTTQLSLTGVNDTSVTGPSDDDYSQLFHIHLPKLASMGFVEWDRAAGVVRAGDRFEEVAPLLRLLDTHAADLPAGWR